MSICARARWMNFVAASLVVAVVARASMAQTGTVGQSFAGVTMTQGASLVGTNYAPPDNDGAVGPNNVVQLINGAYAVYDRFGNQEELISGRQFWINAGIDPGNGLNNLGAFNARIIYDPTSGRWIAAELSGQSTNNNVLLARSDTSNPLGGWQAVSFQGGQDEFVDYTRLGINANGVYISTNNFSDNSSSALFYGTSVFSISKADLLASTPTLANMSSFLDLSPVSYGTSLQPVINFGPSTAPENILGTSTFTSGSALYHSTISGAAAANATLSDPLTTNVTAYSFPPNATQPNPLFPIGTIDDRFSGNVYQVGNVIYAVQAVTAGSHAGLTWYTINATTNAVIQEGMINSSSFDYFLPSIAANAFGNIVITFTRSGSGSGGNLSDFAVVGKTEGNSTTFGTPFLLTASPVGNYQYDNGRWGDYATTVVDPTDPSVFWTFQEYAGSSTTWATQVTQIVVPEPDSIWMAAMALAGLSIAAWRRRKRI